ncbi:unnamed protein product, partial [Nesidiocoris tenuis]
KRVVFFLRRLARETTFFMIGYDHLHLVGCLLHHRRRYRNRLRSQQEHTVQFSLRHGNTVDRAADWTNILSSRDGSVPSAFRCDEIVRSEREIAKMIPWTPLT